MEVASVISQPNVDVPTLIQFKQNSAVLFLRTFHISHFFSTSPPVSTFII